MRPEHKYPINAKVPTARATIKPGFLIVAPRCAGCKSVLVPCVHHTGDGWTWGYECDTAGCSLGGPDGHWWEDWGEMGEGGAYDWPFIEDWAHGADWEAAGVKVV